jgi:Site-specific recombinase XerD
MNDLALPSRFNEAATRAAELFAKIQSFDDVKRYLFDGSGLSAGTYQTYMVAVRQLYDFSGGLNPLQVTAAEIEAFFDDCVTRRGVDRNTAINKIAALKRFYANIEDRLPGFPSPFRGMAPALIKKLSAKAPTQLQRALSATETRALLAELAAGATPKAKADYSTVFFLVVSGLRAAELSRLTFADLDKDPDTGIWTATGVGKGAKPFRQEIADPRAVEAAREAFRATYRREPSPSDRVFFALPRYHGDTPRPMTPHGLWERVQAILATAKDQGILSRDYKVGPHLFRRTCGTLLSLNGMDLVSVSRFLRHASPSTTAKHYICDHTPASPVMNKILAL